ncbi:site-specific DNA-methyltransferase [Bacillus sp. AG4(2022)]|uniref:DNA-methyltransferase n=1 Tax=Bacillus sp. AG4(2022) TaxID=2962594 RepID=UPI002882B28B|nr:site-specific DNA-methyltransferase [Bacillus sp. AG4(2022)]MDT0160448.1 site-specific DNA-methyltransferase [Bacillus sp. AG4(2022)]
MLNLNSIHNLDAITFLEQLYEDYGDESINMFLVDFPYTFKGKNRVTANKWDLPVDIDRFFELAMTMLTKDGSIVLTATNPFASYLIMSHLDKFKYEWIWEKDNGSNFTHVKYQPFKVHEQVLVFGKSATTYVKSGKNMFYKPQFSEGKPYKVNRSGMTDNLATGEGYTRTSGEYEGKRYPRSVQKFNLEKGLHPTQKPTKLFEYLINTYTNESDIVVDCCAGSGTTAVAAKKTNRNYIVNDLEYKYYELMEERLEKIIT